MASPSFTRAGILFVDKPGGMTSHDVVARARRALGTRRVGHAGTLDPMATGLLILGVNGATRLLTFLVGLDKTYSATIRLGESTTTDDAEGESLGRAPDDQVARVSAENIAAGVAGLTGHIEQVPSSVSAIKVDGQRAYARVRAGEAVALAARPVTISRFEMSEIRYGEGLIDVDVVVECSSGTYIRALARDLGFRLGVGGHLTALRRTRIGPFDVDDALLGDVLADPVMGPSVIGALHNPADVAALLFPTWSLTDAEAGDLGHGRVRGLVPPGPGLFAAIDGAGRLKGIVEATSDGVRIQFNMSQEEP